MSINIKKTSLDDVLVVEPSIYKDERGYFYENFNLKELEYKLNKKLNFVQENTSFSKSNVLRGLHYQVKNPQGKLINVVKGKIFDVVVDLRKESKKFGCWTGLELSCDNKKQIWIPPGFAHGFLVLSESAKILYKVTDYWYPENERILFWNDQSLKIKWPITKNINLSDKDKNGKSLTEAEVF